MPVYEFECTCCPARFELKRSFGDEEPVSCPRCGGKARKLFSPVPIIFKGSGFYVTDSRGAQNFTSMSPADEKPKDESPAASPEASTDVKTAPPAAGKRGKKTKVAVAAKKS